MFSVGIVIPSWHYWKDPTRIQPLNELYFATVIESYFPGNEVSVNMVDLRGIRLDQQHVHIPEFDLYLYWIAKTGDYNGIVHIVNKLRGFYKRAKHVAGGVHVDIFSNDCAQQFDAIVKGPGEKSFIHVINDCINGSLKKRYQSEYNHVKYGDYPFMKRHFLPKTAIVNNLLFEKYGSDIRSTCVLFSRGCVFQCNFCVYNVPSVIQMRNPDSIKEEIKYLKDEYQVQAINLKDEICIPLSKSISEPYFKAIGESNVKWRGQTTVSTANEEMLRLAHDSGCVELAIGVESASQQVLDIINKKMKLLQVRKFIGFCKKHNIKVKMCLVLGLPGEPQNIVDITRSFIEETIPDYVSISGLDPIPGSEIYNNPRRYGINYIDKDWSKHAHLLYRFSDEEDVGLPFGYEETNQWGKTFSRTEIVNNIQELQHYLQGKGMTY